ncbi:MAG TPA: helix-hairpin-helix domain-containing protein [Blastocatellia bacterium]|nr:helix-hairpin-helix domain-containing protein [Blastocatellia bacterium]
MRLLFLSVVLVALASCRPAETATNSNSPTDSPNRIESTAVARPRPKDCLNLNIATADELMRLPAIGEVIAKRIIQYRERHGRFRRPEEIIIIEGFSERKYRAIAEMICVE